MTNVANLTSERNDMNSKRVGAQKQYHEEQSKCHLPSVPTGFKGRGSGYPPALCKQYRNELEIANTLNKELLGAASRHKGEASRLRKICRARREEVTSLSEELCKAQQCCMRLTYENEGHIYTVDRLKADIEQRAAAAVQDIDVKKRDAPQGFASSLADEMSRARTSEWEHGGWKSWPLELDENKSLVSRTQKVWWPCRLHSA